MVYFYDMKELLGLKQLNLNPTESNGGSEVDKKLKKLEEKAAEKKRKKDEAENAKKRFTVINVETGDEEMLKEIKEEVRDHTEKEVRKIYAKEKPQYTKVIPEEIKTSVEEDLEGSEGYEKYKEEQLNMFTKKVVGFIQKGQKSFTEKETKIWPEKTKNMLGYKPTAKTLLENTTIDSPAFMQKEEKLLGYKPIKLLEYKPLTEIPLENGTINSQLPMPKETRKIAFQKLGEVIPFQDISREQIEKAKEEQLERGKSFNIIKENSNLEVTVNGTTSLYTIHTIEGDKVTYSVGNSPSLRMRMTLSKMKEFLLGPTTTFKVLESKEIEEQAEPALVENTESHEHLNAFLQKLEQQAQTWDADMPNGEKITLMRELFEQHGIAIAHIEPILTPRELKKKERARLTYEAREEMIQEIGELLKKGIDKIVLHGNTIHTEKGAEVDAEFASAVDLDSRGALFFLNLVNKEYIEYKGTGAYTKLALKGTKGNGEQMEALSPQTPDKKVFPYMFTKNKEDKTTLYLDTSGEPLSYQIGENGTEIFFDHHQQYFSKYFTSSTELTYEVLKKNNMIETEPWMEKMVDFITSVDNLSYVNEPFYNEAYLKDIWPRSIVGIYKDVPFEKIVQWFKEGKDPMNTKFTVAEMNEILEGQEKDKKSKKWIKTEKTLRSIIQAKDEEIYFDLQGAKLAGEIMEYRGLSIQSEQLGKILYHKQDRQALIKNVKKGANPVNTITARGNGFLVAKARGYDTFVTVNEEKKMFMINTQEYNLEKVYSAIKNIEPNAVLARGVMLMQAQDPKKRNGIPEDELFKIVGINVALPN